MRAVKIGLITLTCLLCVGGLWIVKTGGENEIVQSYVMLSADEQQQVDNFTAFLPDDILLKLIECDVFGVETGTSCGLAELEWFDDGRESKFARPARWHHIDDRFSLSTSFSPLVLDESNKPLVTYDTVGVYDEINQKGVGILSKLYVAAWEKMLQRQRTIGDGT